MPRVLSPPVAASMVKVTNMTSDATQLRMICLWQGLHTQAQAPCRTATCTTGLAAAWRSNVDTSMPLRTG